MGRNGVKARERRGSRRGKRCHRGRARRGTFAIGEKSDGQERGREQDRGRVGPFVKQ